VLILNVMFVELQLQMMYYDLPLSFSDFLLLSDFVSLNRDFHSKDAVFCLSQSIAVSIFSGLYD
jgi:hypothetical protein